MLMLKVLSCKLDREVDIIALPLTHIVPLLGTQKINEIAGKLAGIIFMHLNLPNLFSWAAGAL